MLNIDENVIYLPYSLSPQETLRLATQHSTMYILSPRLCSPSRMTKIFTAVFHFEFRPCTTQRKIQDADLLRGIGVEYYMHRRDTQTKWI